MHNSSCDECNEGENIIHDIRLGIDLLAALEPSVETQPGGTSSATTDSAMNIPAMKVAELRGTLKARGLETTGLKAELVKRLTDAMSGGGGGGGGGGSGTGSSGSSSSSYTSGASDEY